MKPDDVKRNDFPVSDGGYDRSSVDAHLAAVAAQIAALEARIAAFEVERDALRRQAAAAAGPTEVEVISEAATPPAGNPVPDAGPGVPTPHPTGTPAEDEVSARLVATKMVLDGTDRDTIRQKLGSEYEIEDLDGLLDDVIERVG